MLRAIRRVVSAQTARAVRLGGLRIPLSLRRITQSSGAGTTSAGTPLAHNALRRATGFARASQKTKPLTRALHTFKRSSFRSRLLIPLTATLATATILSQFPSRHATTESAPVTPTEPAPISISSLNGENNQQDDRFIVLRVFSAGYRLIRSMFRIAGLILRFLPLVVTYPILHLIGARRLWLRYLTWTLERCGPCFIKLGQWAATRPDLFKEDFCEELTRLHRRVASHSFKKSEATILKAFGVSSLDDLFASFSPQPIASGAIAQVHKGLLKDGQTVVAVKVRHPRVRESVERDLHILQSATWLLSKVPTLEWLGLQDGLEQFSRNMLAQVDLCVEGQNLRRFRSNFAALPVVTFPRPIDGMEHESVLVETFEEGVHISEYLRKDISPSEQRGNVAGAAILLGHTDEATHKKLEVSTPASPVAASQDTRSPQEEASRLEQLRYWLASLGFNTFLKMLFVDNFIHVDLHPGNILVREKKCGTQADLVILDAGLVTSLSAEDWRNFQDLFYAVASGNGRQGAELMVQRARRQHATPQQVEQFKDEVDRLLGGALATPLSEIPIGATLSELMSACRKYSVQLEANFATLVVGIIVAEGLSRQLNAKFNLLKETTPYMTLAPDAITEYLRQRFHSDCSPSSDRRGFWE